MKNDKHLEQHQQTAITNTYEFDYLSGVFRVFIIKSIKQFYLDIRKQD